VFLDALDESPVTENVRKDILSWIEDMSKGTSVQLLVTSRSEHDIKTALDRFVGCDATIEITDDLTSDDIEAFVHSYVHNPDGGLGRWKSRPGVQRQIETNLNKNAKGM
jgi:hypothetical protein